MFEPMKEFLFPIKENYDAIAYKYTLDNCVLPSFWEQFGEDPHMSVKVRFPQTLGHTVHNKSLN